MNDWEMIPNRSIEFCPKCGEPVEHAPTKYHSLIVPGEPCGDRHYNLRDDWREMPEHLCRTCANCSYAWVEEVFDAS